MNYDKKTWVAAALVLGICEICSSCGRYVHVSNGKWQIADEGGMLDYGKLNERSILCRKEGEIRQNCLVSRHDI